MQQKGTLQETVRENIFFFDLRRGVGVRFATLSQASSVSSFRAVRKQSSS